MVNIYVFGKTIKINLLKKVQAISLKVHIKQFGEIPSLNVPFLGAF